MEGFNCSGCGACCRKIEFAVKSTMHIPEFSFPYDWDADGACENLIDNKCAIYDDRPLLCNVEKAAEFLNVDKKQFYESNKTVCNSLMIEEKIDKKYYLK